MIDYRMAGIADMQLLADMRIVVLRAANKLPADTEMPEVYRRTLEYYNRALQDGSHAAALAFDGGRVVGAGGVSFFQVLPTYSNPSGQKAYIMNMYTDPAYRRRGIARSILEMLVQECKRHGITAISLEATDMGRPLYEQYGFTAMQNEMELPQ